MSLRKFFQVSLPTLLVCLATTGASAQSFLVQCPTKTPLHPVAANAEPSYTGPSVLKPTVGGVKFNGNTPGQSAPYISNGGAIKCQEISGGDGFMKFVRKDGLLLDMTGTGWYIWHTIEV